MKQTHSSAPERMRSMALVARFFCNTTGRRTVYNGNQLVPTLVPNLPLPVSYLRLRNMSMFTRKGLHIGSNVQGKRRLKRLSSSKPPVLNPVLLNIRARMFFGLETIHVDVVSLRQSIQRLNLRELRIACLTIHAQRIFSRREIPEIAVEAPRSSSMIHIDGRPPRTRNPSSTGHATLQAQHPTSGDSDMPAWLPTGFDSFTEVRI
jgi:hypothetical protein